MSTNLLETFVEVAIKAKKNIAVTGMQGTGKSHFINRFPDAQSVNTEEEPKALAEIPMLKGAICEHHAKDLKTFQKSVEHALIEKGYSEKLAKTASTSCIALFIKMRRDHNGETSVDYAEEVHDDGTVTSIYEDNQIINGPSWMLSEEVY